MIQVWQSAPEKMRLRSPYGRLPELMQLRNAPICKMAAPKGGNRFPHRGHASLGRPTPTQLHGPGLWLVVLLLLGPLSALRAVVFYSTADPNFNTTAPTGTLAGSGWQWVGQWGSFQGAPIGPHHFLTANHVGGAVGTAFIFQGVSYPTIGSYADPSSDLRIWEISGTFPTWAPLYRSGDEFGRGLVVMGRGVTCGVEVHTATYVPNVPVGSLAGWQWGNIDGRLRWGTNTVAALRDGGGFGQQLYATFDQAVSGSECHLGVNDSGSPVFINDGMGWKLAGVAGLVDAYFSTTNSGAGFNACIFDARGLYVGSSGNWSLIKGSDPVPSGFYATRVSVRTAWIDGIVPPQTPDDSADVPAITPVGVITLAALLFGTGARFLGRTRPAKPHE